MRFFTESTSLWRGYRYIQGGHTYKIIPVNLEIYIVIKSESSKHWNKKAGGKQTAASGNEALSLYIWQAAMAKWATIAAEQLFLKLHRGYFRICLADRSTSRPTRIDSILWSVFHAAITRADPEPETSWYNCQYIKDRLWLAFSVFYCYLQL